MRRLLGLALVGALLLFALHTMPAVGKAVHAAVSAITGGSGTLSQSQVEALWVSEGGNGSAALNMARIAYAESGDIVRNVQQGQPPGLTGWGLWQITPTSGITQGGQFGDLLNAANNAKAAIYLFNKDGYGPWSSDPVGKALCGC
jgi:hypothetical protein